MSEKKQEYLTDDDVVPVILYIPNDAISVEMKARIIDENEKIRTATCKWNMKELNNAKIDGQYWEDENIRYRLVDEE